MVWSDVPLTSLVPLGSVSLIFHLLLLRLLLPVTIFRHFDAILCHSQFQSHFSLYPLLQLDCGMTESGAGTADITYFIRVNRQDWSELIGIVEVCVC